MKFTNCIRRTYKMIIYKILNNLNGKVYIGQTVSSLNRRFLQHCRKDSAIGSAIRKYGKENFSIEEIDGANSLSELNYLEKHYINTYNSLAPNGYNLSSGGNNGLHSDETKQKMSKSGKSKVFTIQHRENIAEKSKGNTNNKGKKFSAEWREKMRDSALKRGPRSEETKRKISESLKKRSVCL
jgi:group I intron endonuclease